MRSRTVRGVDVCEYDELWWVRCGADDAEVWGTMVEVGGAFPSYDMKNTALVSAPDTLEIWMCWGSSAVEDQVGTLII